MMPPRLKRIEIENFRSISHRIDVPLDAPVVLIHGSNGAGKTSILSALELALTGHVPSLEQADRSYAEQLLHHGTTEGKVRLTLSSVKDVVEPLLVRVGKGGLRDPAGLPSDLAHFFSERCYLAQAKLGRLLEVYQTAGDDTHSPLTRFVHDLLELDRLDALIDGLEAAGHVARIRRLVPQYSETERAKQRLEGAISAARSDLQELERQAAASEAQLAAILQKLLPDAMPHMLVPDRREELRQRLADRRETEALVRIADSQRTLAVIQRRWERVVLRPSSEEREALRTRLQRAGDGRSQWRRSQGAQLEAALERCRPLFPDHSPPAATDPRRALDDWQQRVGADLAGLSKQLTRDESDSRQLENLEEAVNRAQARLTLVDRELGAVAADAGALAAALAALLPHIHGEDCPVCGRDFAEIGEGSLSTHIALKIGRLSEQSERLRALERERASLRAQVSKLTGERDALAQRRLPEERLFQLKQRLAKLEEAAQTLAMFEDAAARGLELLKEESEAERALADARRRDSEVGELRDEISGLSQQLGVPALGDADPVDAAMAAISDRLEREAAELREMSRIREEAHALVATLVRTEANMERLGADIAKQEVELAMASDGLDAATRQRSTARLIAEAATTARARVIGRVFNESLNRVWRDLFVRLAPSEPFIPRFKVPDTRSARNPVNLETGYRFGGSGGTPGAMLSAGNLNTAALTLFLALHVSVEVQLPWLVLDDPVQSMDEVHITQFAALLRTLSKEHNRQVVIAVHDRNLFEYLKLELSPSYPGDSLITVELSQSSARKTHAVSTPIAYAPDTSISPVAA